RRDDSRTVGAVRGRGGSARSRTPPPFEKIGISRSVADSVGSVSAERLAADGCGALCGTALRTVGTPFDAYEGFRRSCDAAPAAAASQGPNPSHASGPLPHACGPNSSRKSAIWPARAAPKVFVSSLRFLAAAAAIPSAQRIEACAWAPFSGPRLQL